MAKVVHYRFSNYKFKISYDENICFVYAHRARVPYFLLYIKHDNDINLCRKIHRRLDTLLFTNFDFIDIQSLVPKLIEHKFLFVFSHKTFKEAAQVCYLDLSKKEDKLSNFYNACDTLKNFMGSKKFNNVAIFYEHLKNDRVLLEPKLFRTYQIFHSGTEVRE